MARYVLDTAVYIRATRDDGWHREMEIFHRAFAPFLYLHSVVAGELLAGAVKPDLERRTQEHVIAPYESTRRVITPGHGTWKRAGQTIARLIREKKLSPNGVPRSFLNDCLIAASAREQGFTIVTTNVKDFDLIRTVAPVEVAPPWPA